MRWLSAALFPLLPFVFLKESKVWLNSKWVHVLLKRDDVTRLTIGLMCPYNLVRDVCVCVFFLVWQQCASVVFQPQLRADITRFLLKLPGWVSGQTTHAACSEASPTDGATGLRDHVTQTVIQVCKPQAHCLTASFAFHAAAVDFSLAEPGASFGFQMKIYIYISSPSWSCVLKTIIWLRVTHQSAPTRPAALWCCLQKSNRTVLKRSKFISES